MLAIVMVATGAMACYLTWRTRLADIDRDLNAYAEALAAAIVPAEAGTFDLVLPPPARDARAPAHVIWTPGGEILDRSTAGSEPPDRPAPGTRTRNASREVTVRSAAGATILVTQSLDLVYADIWALASRFALLAGTALAASLAVGWWIIGRALAPIDRISVTARRMAEGDFAARIAVERVETELGALARVLNDAFDRLHGSLERQRRFTADASHELRTPIATMSAEAQWALSRTRTLDEYRRSIETCRRTAERMRAIVERLLSLARVEASAEISRVPVDLGSLVHRVVAELRPLADARKLHVDVDTIPVTVPGDPDRLFDAVTNVVANAIQYNQEEGNVRIQLTCSEGEAELTVTDTGIGIATSDLTRVFEPFFRADRSRRRDPGGAGLGLAVTHAIVQQHGGRTHCESAPGEGTRVTISLRNAVESARGGQTSETSPPTYAESRR